MFFISFPVFAYIYGNYILYIDTDQGHCGSWSVPDKVMEDHLKDCFSDTFEYNTENIKFSVFSSQERGTVKFSVFSSQEGGTDIKDGSKMILVPKHCRYCTKLNLSVYEPFAINSFAIIFYLFHVFSIY